MARRKRPTVGPYLLYAEVVPDRVPAAGGYPYSLPAVRDLGRLAFHPKVTFLNVGTEIEKRNADPRGGSKVIGSYGGKSLHVLMAYPDAWIYVLDDDGIRRTAYTATEHYLVTRGFLANPARTLGPLLGLEGDP